jgi:competence protein ComFC
MAFGISDPGRNVARFWGFSNGHTGIPELNAVGNHLCDGLPENGGALVIDGNSCGAYFVGEALRGGDQSSAERESLVLGKRKADRWMVLFYTFVALRFAVRSPTPMRIAEAILRTVYPHVCEFCGVEEAGPSDAFICGQCRGRHDAIKLVEAPFCGKCGLGFDGAITTEFRCANCSDLELVFAYARSAALYSGLVKEVIHRFKYNRHEWFEPFLGQLLIDQALADLRANPIDLVVPIPLFPAKQRTRGFNQAERIAGRLAVALGVAMDTKCLRRIRDTESQARMDRDDREANVKGAFECRESILGQKVLLVDDVLTTGLTASACAAELLKNGAGEVRVWTVARGGLNR